MNIITRRAAVDAGEKYFFTGKPCKHGHLTQRYVGNGGCLECLRPTQNKLAVITSPGEIMVRERPPSPRIEIERQKLELQIEKHKHRLALEQREIQLQIDKRNDRLALAQANLALKLERRQIQQLSEERKSISKTKLVDVNLIIEPEDYEMVVSIVWSYAALKNPLLRRDEIVTGSELTAHRYVMRCFPEDKMEILRVIGEIFSKRTSYLAIEIEQKRRAAVGYFDAEIKAEDNGEPEGDPK